MNEHKELQLKTENQAEAKLFNFRPIFFCAVALCVGIVFGYYRYFHELSLWWLLALLPVVILSVAFARDKRLAVLAVAVLVIAFSLGNGLWSAQIRTYADVKGYDGEFTVRGRVVESSVSKSYCTLVLDEVKIGEKGEEGKLVAYMPTAFYYTVRLSDEISIYGKVRPMTDVRENIYFATSVYDDIRFRLSSVDIEQFETLGHKADLFLDIRQRIVDTLFAGMDETSASVTMAVLLGDTSTMDQSLLSNMRYGGIAHVFAVSGLHVGALFAFLLAIFSKRRALPGAAKWLIAAGVLAFYGGICGFSARVARALVMCLAFYSDKLFGGKRDSAESMGKAAALVLAVSPAAIFDAGFLLSFGAVAGILSLSPVISRLLSEWIPARGRGRKALRGAVAAVSVSLGATAVTLPVMCRCFGYVSGGSLLLNVFIVPLVSAVFPVFLALAAVAAAVPPLAGAALYLPSLALSGLSTLFYAADFSAFAIEFPFSAVSLAGYYGACLCAGDKVNLRYRVRVAGIFAGLFVCSAGFFL